MKQYIATLDHKNQYYEIQLSIIECTHNAVWKVAHIACIIQKVLHCAVSPKEIPIDQYQYTGMWSMWLRACTNWPASMYRHVIYVTVSLYQHNYINVQACDLFDCEPVPTYLHECTGMWSMWLWACTNITTSMYRRHVIYVTESLYQHTYMNVQACDLFDCEPVPTYLHECTGMWSIWLWACTNIPTWMYRHVIYLTVSLYQHTYMNVQACDLFDCEPVPT